MKFIKQYLGRNGTPIQVASAYDGTLSSLGLANGNSLTIPVGQTWLNDLSTSPTLGYITIAGTLVRDPTKDVQLNGTGILVTGTGALLNGTASSVPNFRYDIVLSGAVPGGRILGPSYDGSNNSRNTPNDGGGASRGILINDGGRIEMYGTVPNITQTTLADQHVNIGDTSIKVAGLVYWKAGWKFTLGMTTMLKSLSQADSTLVFTVDVDTVPNLGTNTTVINIREGGGVPYFRWGKLQYATGAGMSLTNDGFTGANMAGHVPSWMTLTQRNTEATRINAMIASEGIPTVLDQRAHVSLLTRTSWTISAPNDTAYSGNERFGVHIMKMGNTGTCILKGGEIFNCGQGGALGRYPTHFHLNSLNGSTVLGPVANGSHVIDSCSIHDSHNRAVSIHSIQNAKFTNNVVYNIKGAAVFTEDGYEDLCEISGNTIQHVRDPGTTSTTPAPNGYRIQAFDQDAPCLWVSNPGCIVKFNRMSDAPVGRWAAFAYQLFGPSAALTSYVPNSHIIREFHDNSCHGTFVSGAKLVHFVTDQQGNPQGVDRFRPTTDGTSGGPAYGYGGAIFSNEVLYLNAGDVTRQLESTGINNSGGGNSGNGNYINQADNPEYKNWVVADCIGTDFSGAVNFGRSHGHLGIAKSLNKDSLQDTATNERCFAASYHNLLTIDSCIAIGYQDGNIMSGIHYGIVSGNAVIRSNDLYLNDPEMAGAVDTGFGLIDSILYWRDPGFGFFRHATTPPDYTTVGISYSGSSTGPGLGGHYLATSVYDKDGSWGQMGMPDSYIIPNHPFWTYGLSGLVDPWQINVASFSKISPTVHYGIEPYSLPGLGGRYGTGAGKDTRYTGGVTYTKADPTTFTAVSTAVCIYDQSLDTDSGLIQAGQHTSLSRGSATRVRQTSNYSGTAGQAGLIQFAIRNLFRTVHCGWAADDFMFVSVAWPDAAADPNRVAISGGNYYFDPPIAGDIRYGKTYFMPKAADTTALRALTGKQAGWCRGASGSNEIWLRVAWNIDGEGQADGYPSTPGLDLRAAYDSYAGVVSIVP